MKKFLLIPLLFVLVHSVFSQQDSILQHFKFRNVNYRAITLFTDANGSYNHSSYVPGNAESHSVGASWGGGYFRIISTDRILFNLNSNLGFHWGKSRSDNTNNENKSRNFYVSPYINVSNKWFSKNFFTEAGAEVWANLNNGKDFSNPAQEATRDLHSVRTSVTLGIGKGRLENVIDMQNALWLNKSLEQEGQLSRSLSAEELTGLGQAIVRANNTRVLDARRRTRFVLETIDGYLQEKGLIARTDIKYFSNLNDIVFFAFNNPRLSGKELFIRLTPGLTHASQEYQQKPPVNKNKEKIVNKSVALSMGLNRHKPVSLYHQNNYGASVHLNYLSHDYNQKFTGPLTPPNEITFNPELKRVSLNAFYEHALYPNTRTIVSIRLDPMGGYQEQDDESSFYAQVNFAVVGNYFISYRTRFTCAAGVIYRDNVYTTDNDNLVLIPRSVSLYAGAGLQVAL